MTSYSSINLLTMPKSKTHPFCFPTTLPNILASPYVSGSITIYNYNYTDDGSQELGPKRMDFR